MYCHYAIDKDELKSYASWEVMCDHIPVFYQINDVVSTVHHISLTEFFGMLQHNTKEIKLLSNFLSALCGHENFIFSTAKTFVTWAPHGIDRKSVHDAPYNETYLRKLVETGMFTAEYLYIERNIKSVRTKNGKRESLQLFLKGNGYKDGDHTIGTMFKRVRHLHFIDNIVFQTEADSAC